MGNTLQKKPNENLEKEEGEGNGSSFNCGICVESVAASKKFKNKSLCTHPFCQDCIARYIQVKVQDDNIAKIECPGLDWFERSYCPNKNCMAMVVNECERSGKVKKTQCPNCKQWFCFQCKLKWHAGYRCEESGNLRDRNDIVFGQRAETMNWARCPACGHCVEKVKGCSYVLCRCKTRFCYKCGRKTLFGCPCQATRYCRLMIANIAIIVVMHVVVLAIMKKIGLKCSTAPDPS
ncbi:hypothetical protein AB3S75_022850 [Citrus x aurantiifolia]